MSEHHLTILPQYFDANEEPKECPFCGGTGQSNTWTVVCARCGCTVTGKDRQDAIRRWNRRPSPQSGLVEELVTALREIAKADGRFSVDRYDHACNVIENMQALANAALAKAQPRQGDETP